MVSNAPATIANRAKAATIRKRVVNFSKLLNRITLPHNSARRHYLSLRTRTLFMTIHSKALFMIGKVPRRKLLNSDVRTRRRGELGGGCGGCLMFISVLRHRSIDFGEKGVW